MKRNSPVKDLSRYSMGVGDRFSHQGRAQLRAIQRAAGEGIEITPVWNKSHREHQIIGTDPEDVRREAEEAVGALGWDGPYFVDADHIGLGNVDLFIESSDFFTLDVADFIGQPADEDEIEAFVRRADEWTGGLEIPGLTGRFDITPARVQQIARKYLGAVREAGKIYRHIRREKGTDGFVTEVSMDETDRPQTPEELLFILQAIAREGIPARTIAPKFTGRFNKGVDYVGDVEEFAGEFNADLAIIAFAVEHFDLPRDLKLSIHSGSDKFSLYGPIHEAIEEHHAGLHIKTAGTTWLEELIGLAESGEDGLQLAKEIYARAHDRREELCEPYADVVDISEANLPPIGAVESWSGEDFADALRHDQSCARYNPDFRQLLHVAYRIAAEMGGEYQSALCRHEEAVGQNVTENLYARHIRPVFLG